MKVLANEIIFGCISFVLAVLALKVLNNILPEPEIYVIRLFIHIVEIITLMFIVRNIMKNIPGVFDVPFVRDNTLISATVLSLVDWNKLAMHL